MTLHRPMAALIMAATLIAPTVVACSNDDDKATSSTTTTARSTETTTASVAPSDGPTTSAPAPTPFNEGVAAVNAAIDSSGGDVCKVLAVLDQIGTIADPADATEGKQAVEVIVKFFNSLADSAPAELSAEAATIRRTVEKIETEAAQANYDPAILTSETGFTAFQDPEFAAAMGKFSTQAQQQCSDLGISGGSSGN